MNKQDKAVLELCNTINKLELSPEELTKVLPRFLFSLGAGLEDCNLKTNEEVLIRYANNPTLGNALMAQALWMNETWVIPTKERQKKDD